MLMLRNVAIDIYPLCSSHSGIGRSVSGLMAELPGICAASSIPLITYFRQMLGTNESLGVARFSPRRIRLPRFMETCIARLGLIEMITQANLFHATDFYLPLKPSTPMIATVYDVIYALDPEGTVDQQRIAQQMQRRVRQCIRVICCSEYTAREFCTLYGYPRNRVSIIPLGIDSERFLPTNEIAARAARPYFLAVSCNTTRKNTPRLVRAFLRYAQAGGRNDLRMAWTLPESLADEVRAAGLQDRVIALGKVGDDELLALYQGAVCVMFPSLYEGFGFPVLEALACGVPVLTTHRSSLPEVGGDLALYVDGEDIDEMTQQMLAFDSGHHDKLAVRIRHEGPAWASNYTWQRCAEQTVEVYLSALAELQTGSWQPLQLKGNQ